MACSTTQVAPLPVIPPAPPPYVHVPHPPTLDDVDVRALMVQKEAPSHETYQTCEKEYFDLRQKTNSRAEIQAGVRALVKKDPVAYHWCFYSKIVQLEDDLRKDLFLDERQKMVIQHYLFLTPVARAFYSEFNDSRYLRLAVNRYQKLSEYVFYRRVTPSQALFTDRTHLENEVLSKYGMDGSRTPAQKLLGDPAPQQSGADNQDLLASPEAPASNEDGLEPLE